MKSQGQATSATRHEKKDADTLGLAMVAAFLLLIVAICFLCVFGLLGVVRRAQTVGSAARAQMTAPGEAFPPSRLQTNPELELKKSREAARTKLNSYGWIDRRRGIAHIPIERAMELAVERGLPEVGGGQTRLQLMQARPLASPAPTPGTIP